MFCLILQALGLASQSCCREEQAVYATEVAFNRNHVMKIRSKEKKSNDRVS